MNNECRAQTSDEASIYTCNRCSGHSGKHRHEGSDGEVYMQWDRDSPYQPWYQQEYKTGVLEEWQKQTTVLLTLEDLKAIAYYLPPYSDDRDDADNDVKAKIDKALKEML
jgi:hypothetical protein